MDMHAPKNEVLHRREPCVLQQLRSQWCLGTALPGECSLRHLPPELLTCVLQRIVCPKPFQPFDDETSHSRLYWLRRSPWARHAFYSKAVYTYRQVCKLFQAEAFSLLETIRVEPNSYECSFPGFCDLAVERMALAPNLQCASINLATAVETEQLRQLTAARMHLEDDEDLDEAEQETGEPDEVNPATLARTLPACSRLRELILPGGRSTPLPGCVAAALSSCSTLRFLVLDCLSVYAASSAAFAAALQGLPALYMLRLSDAKFSDPSAALPFEALTTLRHVCVQDLASIAWQDFLRLPNLQTLAADACMSRALPACETLSPHLEVLDLGDSGDFADIPLRAVKSLRMLGAECVQRIPPAQVEALTAVLRAPRALESLVLWDPPLAILQATTALSSLTRLKLWSLRAGVEPDDVAQLLPRLPALRQLALEEEWDPDEMMPLLCALPLCRQLTSLHLADTVDGAAARVLASALAQGAPLRELDLRGVCFYDDAKDVCSGLTHLLSVKL